MKKTLKFKTYKRILTFTIVILLIGCNNKYEKDILGTWYSLKENEKLRFSSDSLFVNGDLEVGTWKADQNEIEFKRNDYLHDSIKKSTNKYQLVSKDTLVIFSENNPNYKSTFLKSDNFSDFLFKKNNINLSLENNQNAKFQRIENKYGIKVFVGYRNGSIIIKSEYSEDINHLENDLEKKLIDINPYFRNEYNDLMKERMTYEEWIRMNIYYSLFVDENISEEIVKNVIEKLQKTKVRKIYRIFKTQESNYADFYNLKAIKL